MRNADGTGTKTEWTWRRRFSGLTVAATVVLICWGGVVTSIGAGMAFPDWPTSLGSYNLINPVEEWWAIPAYLAEHGHRLIASLVGLLTVLLAGWTWWADPRGWMRKLGIAAVVLVIAQGVLGGLRVLWVSVDMAFIHACVAQLFFAVLVAMALFTTETWRSGVDALPATGATRRLRWLAYGAAAVIYGQIVLGALLRHRGAGLSGAFTTIHVAGAFIVVGLVGAVFVEVEKRFADYDAVRRSTRALTTILSLQFALGLATLIVLYYERLEIDTGMSPVVLTVAHLVVGAFLFGASIVTALLIGRCSRSALTDGEADSTAQSPLLRAADG